MSLIETYPPVICLSCLFTGPKDRRPFLASDCDDLSEAEKWRREVIKETSKKVQMIQNGENLGHFSCFIHISFVFQSAAREMNHIEVAETGCLVVPHINSGVGGAPYQGHERPDQQAAAGKRALATAHQGAGGAGLWAVRAQELRRGRQGAAGEWGVQVLW